MDLVRFDLLFWCESHALVVSLMLGCVLIKRKKARHCWRAFLCGFSLLESYGVDFGAEFGMAEPYPLHGVYPVISKLFSKRSEEVEV
jgi:hypothetical protein